MTLEQLQFLMKASLDSYGEGYFGEDDMPEGMELVEEDDWTQDGKYQYSADIYKDDEGNFFCVNNSRSGSYHTDWNYMQPTVRQVKRVEKTIVQVVWEAI